MQAIIPKRLEKEREYLTELWLNGEDTFDEILSKHGSEEYKKYSKQQEKRRTKLKMK